MESLYWCLDDELIDALLLPYWSWAEDLSWTTTQGLKHVCVGILLLGCDISASIESGLLLLA